MSLAVCRYGKLYHHISIFPQLWLTSHLRTIVVLLVLLDTGTPGTSTESYSEDVDDGSSGSSSKLCLNFHMGAF